MPSFSISGQRSAGAMPLSANARFTRTRFAAATVILSLLVASRAAAAHVVYVKQDAPGPSNGMSWPTAYRTLEEALDVAAGLNRPTEIWIAQGTYVPNPDGLPDPRYATFTLPADVSLYGGFAGTESSRDGRDPELHETILSGDVLGNDNDFPYDPENFADNVAHVVTAIGADAYRTLDSLTISNGHASQMSDWDGGGLVIEGDSTIRRCQFRRNRAEYNLYTGWGGAVAVRAGRAVFVDCVFTDNAASSSGGALYVWKGASVEVRSSSFRDNHAGFTGGALHVGGGQITIIDSEIADNESDQRGGGMAAEGEAVVEFMNTTFAGNRAIGGGGASLERCRAITIDGCTFQDNDAAAGGGGLVIYDRGGSFQDSNRFIITRSFFIDNYSAVGSGIDVYDTRLEVVTIADTEFRHNGFGELGGGLYWERALVIGERLLFFSNTADKGGAVAGCYGSLDLKDSRLDLNGAGDGGGLFAGERATALLERCAITRNRAYYSGGGVLTHNGDTTLTSCLLTGNNAAFGGGIAHTSGILTVDNTTVYRNVGQVAVGGVLAGTGATIRNSILWANHLSDSTGSPDVEDEQVLGIDVDSVNFSIVAGWSSSLGGIGNSGADPMFVDPVGPDGYTSTSDDDYRLLPDSPAVNAGDPNTSWWPGIGDLDGHTRVLCGRVDIGAYEFGIGDFDCNGTVSLFDFTKWAACAEGPDHLVPGEPCGAYDFNANGTIDLHDFAGFARTIAE